MITDNACVFSTGDVNKFLEFRGSTPTEGTGPSADASGLATGKEGKQSEGCKGGEDKELQTNQTGAMKS